MPFKSQNQSLVASRNKKLPVSSSRVQSRLISKSRQNQAGIEQIIQTLNLYIKSAQQLCTNLFQGLNPDPREQKSERIIERLHMFVMNCEGQLQEVVRNTQFLPSEKLEIYVQNQHKMLQYFQEKYNELIKEAYRTLNAQIIMNTNLSQADISKIKQNRRKKIDQIEQVELQMERCWKYGHSNSSKISNSQHTTNLTVGKNDQKNKRKSSSSFMVPLINQKTKKSQIFEVLGMLSQEQLQEMAEEQLQKEFLSIRIAASNLYQNYQSHEHSQQIQQLKAMRQHQQSLMRQVHLQIQKSNQLQDAYYHLQRQLSELKTVNELIKRRNVVKQSIKMDIYQDVQASIH